MSGYYRNRCPEVTGCLSQIGKNRHPRDLLENYFIGDPNGEPITLIDDDSINDAIRPQITVYSYSVENGKLRRFEHGVPKGATVLDFAFIVSSALALTVKSAHIKKWTGEKPAFSDTDYKYPLGTVLNEGDVVYFDADYYPKLGIIQNHATIDWFSHINTERAKKSLIDYFKTIYS